MKFVHTDLMRHQRVHRTVEHTGIIRRPFDDVVEIVERMAPRILSAGTKAADREARLLEPELHGIPAFDPQERLRVVIQGGGSHAATHVWLEFTWEANRDKRLLANVDCRLDFHPLLRSGPRAKTELRLRAEYDPPQGHRHSPETVMFGRRVVRVGLLRLVQEVTGFIEDYEETIELRIHGVDARNRAYGSPADA